MDNIRICGVVICAVIVCVVFKSLKSEYSLLIRLAVTVGISIISLTLFYPIISFIDSISKDTAIYSYIPILLKALGIAITVQITSDICKDADEKAMAERISLFGKAEILILSLPLIKSVFELCGSIMEQ